MFSAAMSAFRGKEIRMEIPAAGLRPLYHIPFLYNLIPRNPDL
jgi:hypothetical protein